MKKIDRTPEWDVLRDIVFWRLEATRFSPSFFTYRDAVSTLELWLEWAQEDYEQELVRMAKKSGEKVAWKGFVDIALTTENLDDFLSWEYSQDELAERVTDMLSEGYKFGLSWDSKQMQVVCSVTGREPGDKNAGYTFVSKAPTWEKALALSTYKHREVSDGDWLGIAGEERTLYS